jgi:hypothetical protein
MSTRALDFALTGNKGVKVFPDTTTLPNVNDALAVASLAGNEVFLKFAPVAVGGPYLPIAGGTVTGHTAFARGSFATGDGTNFTSDLTGTAYASGVQVTTTFVGSGVNGPNTAQNAMSLSLQKNWTAVGDGDVLSIFGRQSGPGSDMGGILVNVQNTGTGFLAGHEYASSSIDSAGFFTNYIDSQEAVINGTTTSYGHVYTAAVGSFRTGVLVQSAPNPNATFTGSIAGTTLTVSASGTGYISPRTVLTGTGVAANTIVTSQLTGGAGGVGTYAVNNSQTVASTALTTTYQASWTNYFQGVQQGQTRITLTGAGDVVAYRSLYVQTGGALIQGNMSDTSGAGGYLMWNKGGGDGATWLLNNKGGGAGGIHIGAVDNSGNVTDRLVIDGAGLITASANMKIVGTTELDGAVTTFSPLTAQASAGAPIMWQGNNTPLSTYTGGGLGWNYTGGQAEVDFFNTFVGPTTSFVWYQSTSPSAKTVLMTLSPAGNLTVGGALGVTGAQVIGTGTGAPTLTINGAAGTGEGIIFENAGTTRFSLIMDASDNLGLFRFSAAGAYVDNPLFVSPVDGAVYIANNAFITGSIGVHGAAPPAKPIVTGAKNNNPALASLLTALAAYGLLTDSSTA